MPFHPRFSLSLSLSYANTFLEDFAIFLFYLELHALPHTLTHTHTRVVLVPLWFLNYICTY